VQTLLVSATIDFSTSADYATEEVLSYLSNGQHIILAEPGHMDHDGLQPKRRNADQVTNPVYALADPNKLGQIAWLTQSVSFVKFFRCAARAAQRAR